MTPRTSVVVATHGRAPLLPRLVEALDAQGTTSPFEVVIVDDGSTDSTARVLAELGSRRPASAPAMRVIRLGRRGGPATARNVGWRAAGGDVVAFTDDDCVPAPGWVEALTGALGSGAGLAQGATLPDPAQDAVRGPFSRTMEVTSETGYYQTCNVAYRRDWLERLGGFDERFRYPAGEDTDLAWRARGAGARSLFVRDAVVHHDVRPSSLWIQLRDTPRWDGVVLCAREHPELRTLFHRPWCWKASHPPAALAMTGLAAAALGRGRGRSSRASRVLLATALVFPYVRYRVRTEPLAGGRRRRLLAIPGALLVDLAEVGVMARSSLRHRSLLL
ncbi:MAG: glycosyltransferase family 2 protein [Acidimicrobiales bacterium]